MRARTARRRKLRREMWRLSAHYGDHLRDFVLPECVWRQWDREWKAGLRRHAQWVQYGASVDWALYAAPPEEETS